MREIVFDTETTGLDSKVERIIEIGAIELLDRFPTGKTFHVYIHPQDRQIHPDAQAVHGISMADLAGKPTFDKIADEFAAFIEDAMLVARARFYLGMAWEAKGQKDLAKAAYERVVAMWPKTKSRTARLARERIAALGGAPGTPGK